MNFDVRFLTTIMNLKIEFTDKEITPWGGISLMRQMLNKLSVNALFEINVCNNQR
jgi:hypothetical protein